VNREPGVSDQLPGVKLILVRHSLPEILPAVPANQWRLSAEGRSRCPALAEQLAAYKPQALFSSLEPKAIETAQILSERLSLPFTPTTGLHEHERPAAARRFSRAEFEATLARFFDHPDELVFGTETAAQAQQRFSTAMRNILTEHPGQTLAVVAHGTVMSLFVAYNNSIDPFTFWKSLALPCFVVLSLLKFTIETISPDPQSLIPDP
jgi:broad specificity phosphatase PhoE